MRVAYLVMNHRPPTQLLRLLSTLRRGDRDAPIVVHHDRFRSRLEPAALEPLGKAQLLTSDEPLSWGTHGIVDASWRSLTWMLERVEFDWVVLLSGQDYPIKPLRSLHEMLSQTDADVFLNAVRIDDVADHRERKDKRLRYLYQYRRIPTNRVSIGPERFHRLTHQGTELFFDLANTIQPYVKFYKLPDGLPRCIGVRARSTPFSTTFPCWYGETWPALSHRAVRRIVDVPRQWPDYLAYYRKTVIPSESAMITIVCNDPDLKVEPRDLHHIRWSRRTTGHPDVFGATDIEELLASSGYFARKFDITQDTEILDRLDLEILPAS
ncbi:MAG: beta-1,6-N-acetylglucosaminyltransferase [Acidimicrobiales bacterium]